MLRLFKKNEDKQIKSCQCVLLTQSIRLQLVLFSVAGVLEPGFLGLDENSAAMTTISTRGCYKPGNSFICLS